MEHRLKKMLDKKQILSEILFHQRSFWLFLAIIVVFAVSAKYLIFLDPVSDERVYYNVIVKVFNNDLSEAFSVSRKLMPMIPGYPAILGVVTKVVGTATAPAVRVVSTCLVLPVLVMSFRRIHFLLHGAVPSFFETLKYLLLPILFPYLFLIFTDSMSLALILLTLYFVLCKRYSIAGITGILSLMIRQNNVVWLVFFTAILLSQENPLRFRQRILKANGLLLSLLFFLVFVVLNSGLIWGDRSSHGGEIFNFGNIFFILVVFFWLYFPSYLNKDKVSQIIKAVSRHFLAIFVLLLSVFIVYMADFDVSHKYNFVPGYFRNSILVLMASDIPIKIFFFSFIALSLLFLFNTKFTEKKYLLLYPFSLLYLIPSKLIEHRYYIIPLVLFMLFRQRDKKENSFQLVWFLLVCTFEVGIIVAGYFL